MHYGHRDIQFPAFADDKKTQDRTDSVWEATVPVYEILSGADSTFAEFEQGDGTDHVNGAVVLGSRQVLDHCPPGHHMQWRSLTPSLLAIHLKHRYNCLGTIVGIKEVIVCSREALELCPEGHPDRSASLHNVALFLSDRYDRLGEMMDLNGAIILARQALELCPSGDPDRSTSLNNVANYLSNRYQQLEEMTASMRPSFLGGKPSAFARQGSRIDQCHCTIYLSDRYNRLGDMLDLNEAIILAKQALDLRPPGHLDRSASLNNIVNYLSERYNGLGDVTDLNEVIILGRQALDLCPSGHSDRSMSLHNVAICLSDRYDRLGDMKDLNEAIILVRQALNLRPLGHPDRSMSLNNVAVYLSDRCIRLGDMADLNEAIILARQALDLCPSGHPDRSMSLNNVAIYLSDRCNRLGDMSDLDEAIILGRQALDLRPPGHPRRSTSLNNAALTLNNRYNRVGDIADLNEAIIFGRQSIDLRPPGHPRRSMSLKNVAIYLSSRYDQLRDITDLNEAIILGRQALDLFPSGHPDRSSSLQQLAVCLRVWFNKSRELKDRKDLFSLYTDLTNISQTVSPVDLSAAKEWVCAAEDFRHPTTLLAYETSLRLLIQHLATLPSLPNHLHIFKDLASSLAIDAFSACLRNQHVKKAVELLEQGRGVFWNQIARLRSPLQDVIASGQEGDTLADKFTRLSSEIHNTIHSQDPDQHEKLCNLNVDLQSTITKIWKLPGLGQFLLPSSFSDLQHAASGGPVVIVNASQYTCDALVIFFDRDPVHIPLQITKSRVQELSSQLQSLTLDAKSMDMGRDLACFLRILWDEVVSLIADFLQTTVPPYSRIWWCPIAELCLLPLHAASPYRREQRKFSDLYISSYTSTLTALIRARRDDPLATTSIHQKNFLAVGQAKASSTLSAVVIIAERIQGLATLIQLDGPESSVSQVSKELRRSEWAHFACHGIPNRKQPFDSAFGLHDGHFTVERIMGCELENPEFAYLSACHTTAGDEESPDKVIHLASAMQFAGFRSVIGTMWAVDDGHTNKIVSRFYENLMDGSDHTRAALGLQKTMDSLTGSVPLDQRILYVHIGA